MIYLDNAATTQIDRRVLESMMPYLTTQYGNAGTLYKFGRAANEALQSARAQVFRFVGADNGSIIFTSGGSESNNLVFHGAKEYLKRIGRTHVLVSAVEHDSVLRAAESLTKEGFDVGCIPVQGDGSVSLTALEGLLRPDTGLVSVMYVNNETGAVNPVCDIGSLCMKHGIRFCSPKTRRESENSTNWSRSRPTPTIPTIPTASPSRSSLVFQITSSKQAPAWPVLSISSARITPGMRNCFGITTIWKSSLTTTLSKLSSINGWHGFPSSTTSLWWREQTPIVPPNIRRSAGVFF